MHRFVYMFVVCLCLSSKKFNLVIDMMITGKFKFTVSKTSHCSYISLLWNASICLHVCCLLVPLFKKV